MYAMPPPLARGNMKVTIVADNCRHAQPARLSALERVPQEYLDLFCQNLKRQRTNAGLSQEALAERADISVRYLQLVESGRFGVSFAVLLRLRRALGCSWNKLLDGME